MKTLRSTGLLFLMLTAILFSLCSCGQTDTSSSAAAETTSQTQPAVDAADLYSKASEEIMQANDLCVNIECKTTLTFNDQSFTSDLVQVLSYTGRGTGQMLAQCHETLTVGNHSIEIADYYGNSTGYTTIGGIGFSSNMSEDDFLARYLSSSLLDANLYGVLNAETVDGNTMLVFSDATKPEVWACSPAVQVSHASGAAVLDSNAHLKSCTYTLYGTYNDIEIKVFADVTVNTSSIAPATLPDNLSEYAPVSYLDGPKLLEKATGYLLQSKSVTATNNQAIQSQAFMLSRTITTQLDMYQDTGHHNSRRTTTVTTSSTGPEETAKQYRQEELYKDGKYHLIADGQMPTDDRTVTAESMHTYCQDLLVSTVLMPQYITDAKYTEADGLIKLTYTANEDLAKILADQASDTLYGDPGLLNNLASGYETTSVDAYLTLDAVTGLPIASGISYSGTHTIEEFAYSLVLKHDQSYVLASASAKDTINALDVSRDTASEPSTSVETAETTGPAVTEPK